MAHVYKSHPDYAGEVDHAQLIARLVEDFPDGWALSTSMPAMRYVLGLCPENVNVMAWCRPNANSRPWIKSHVVYAWEPVILQGGRERGLRHRAVNFVVEDTCKDKGCLIGRKPDNFCFWLFRCLGALPGDELVDLYPGSGAVGRAWDKFQRQMTLPFDEGKAKTLPLALEAAP